jgi:large subunit ribosomal protein L14
VKKKDVYKAVIVRQTKPFRRKDGSYVSFDDNAVVLIEKQGKEMGPKGNRVFGPVPRELTERGWANIAGIAPEIV